jgi:hypothetical protein
MGIFVPGISTANHETELLKEARASDREGSLSDQPRLRSEVYFCGSIAMAVAVEQPTVQVRGGQFSLSGMSVLMALGLAVWEVYFFWGAGRNLLGLDGTVGWFTPDRLGFNMAWLVFFYLAFQIISIPFAMSYRERLVGVLDGLASVIPLVVAAVAIVGHPELLGTPGRWEAAILLVLVSLADLIGGYAITVGLSRRTIGFGAPASP